MLTLTKSGRIQIVAFAAVLLASGVFLPSSTFAQDSIAFQTPRNWGYAFVGAHQTERVESNLQFSRAGIGWEWLTFKGLGVGAEAYGHLGGSRGIDAAFDVSYHFENLPKVGRTIAPFVRVGGTIALGLAGDGIGYGDSAYIIGSGARLWPHHRIAPLIELRKYGSRGGKRSETEFRAGFTFRLFR
jgi:hypothetical protein